MRTARVLLLILLAGAALLGVLRWWRAEGSKPAGREELRIAFATPVSGVDPRTVRAPPSLTQRMTDALWDELVAFNPRTLNVEPRVARSWQVSEDGRRYIFHLGAGQRWSNGEPVTAGDFVRTVHWLLARDAEHPLLRLLGEASRPSGNALEGQDEISVTAPDDLTLEVRLKDPPPDFLPSLAALCWIPLHRSSTEAFERNDWSEPDRLVSNGPFRLRHFGAEEILLERNSRHGQAPGFERIRLLRTETPLLYPALIRAGRADFGDALNFLPTRLATPPPGVGMEHENTASVSTLQFNTMRGPLRDPRIRRALSLALDRAALAGSFGEGGALPAFSFTPPGQAEALAGRTVQEDLVEARRLLAEAGYPDGRDFPVLRMPVMSGPDQNRLPFYCAEQWRTRLGLRVYTPELPREEIAARLARGEFDVMHYRWVASPLDFSTLSQQLSVPLPRTFHHETDPRVATAVLAARRLVGKERLQAMLAAENELMLQMPATPVLLYHRYTLRSERVAGWSPDIFGRHPLRAFRPAAHQGGSE